MLTVRSDANGFQEDAVSNDEQQCQSESQSQVTECGEIVQVQCEATSFCYIF